MEPTHFESLYPENTREKEIARVLDYIKRGNSCQIVGLAGTGRSNLLKLLSYNRNVRMKHLGENQKWFHFVYMDISEVRKRPFFEVMEFILITLTYSLLERKFKEEHNTLNLFLKDVIKMKDELIMFQGLKKSIDYLAIERELTIVLLFDRFDQYIGNITDTFFTNLKILRNRAKYRFSAIFSLARPLEDMLEPAIYSEFYEFLIGNVVYLPIFDPVGTEFRFSYLEKVAGKKADERTKQEILKLTGGHGKLSRLALEVILGEDKIIKDLSSLLLSKTQIRGSLFEIWSSLTPSEQNILRASSIEPNSYLENVGLVKDGKITIQLLEESIKMLPPTQEIKITYDPERNEIMKGNEAITDKLSPSEFRLLRYLLQNEGKVCEKEEIISAVWRETKTQQGVTDQALDQIIYRLRKKIETEPNNPTHIYTVKGRGYKFSG